MERAALADWNNECGIRSRPLEPFGIEIDGDLAAPMDAEMQQSLVTMFRETGLIVARSQRLDMDQQIALMALLGPVVRRTDCIGYVSSEGGYCLTREKLGFRADYAFGPYPLQGLSLYAFDLNDDTSSTRFANAERACLGLPAPLRTVLDTHKVEMVSAAAEDIVIMRACEERDPAVVLREERPSIVHNPRSGRSCIGVNEMHAAQLVGMSWRDSRDILNMVYDFLYAPENILEHVWRKGDIVIWDNVTVHHARGSLPAVGRRVLQRVCTGEKGLYEMFPDQFPGTAPFYVPGDSSPA
jgi:taurine dioxygenase